MSYKGFHATACFALDHGGYQKAHRRIGLLRSAST
jgi:hypothetical protein